MGALDSPPASPALEKVLARARERKFLGPLPLSAHVANGNGFVAAIESARAPQPLVIVDLGSGGGVPALVIAEQCPDAKMTLVERGVKRAEFLEGAVRSLGLDDRVDVVCAEAEDVARRLEGTASVVTARSFGPPAVTAECACRFLQTAGVLVVSEPPDDEQRWSHEGLSAFGLAVDGRVSGERGTFQLLRRTTAPLADRYPRRAGVPRKRPLW